MGAIFVSYRRGDSEGQARALFNELTDLIGKNSVFMDVDSIALGRDFRQILQERLGSCDLMLALIGPDWLDIRDASGNRRLEGASDFVRQEIAAALRRNIPITPVLVRGAQMPAPEQLPDDLKDLAYRNGFELSHTRWDSDVREMVKRLGLGEADVQKALQAAIVEPGSGAPVAHDNGSAVAGPPLSSSRIAISAAATGLVLVSLVAWCMSGGNSQLTGLTANLTPTLETTSVAHAPAPAEPITNETLASAPNVASKPAPPKAPPTATKQGPAVAASSRAESTIRSLVAKDGGTPGTQRSPQLDHQETFETTGALRMEFLLNRGSCSKARFHIFIDGKFVTHT